MKKYLTFTVLSLSAFVISCNEESKKQVTTQNTESFDPKVNVTELQADFMKWWTYHSNNISLSSNFEGKNENSEIIDKKQFLEALTSGEFIPLKLKAIDVVDHYKLCKLDASADKSIVSTIKSTSSISLKHFNMEGLRFPKFNVTDLNGNQYTNETIKGKITVFKTWFINCKACVAEFPELNEFVENHDTLIFISLALDPKPELEAFLKKNDFKYPVIPNQKAFIGNLQLQIYPTHIVVDDSGTILKVVNKASEMITFLDHIKKAAESMSKPPPPPPPPPLV